jgi:hypothetical protein
VRIEAKALLTLETSTGTPMLRHFADPIEWVRKHFTRTPMLKAWLGVHRRHHPDAGDYPRGGKDDNIYSYHTDLRAKHTRARRYTREGGR